MKNAARTSGTRAWMLTALWVVVVWCSVPAVVDAQSAAAKEAQAAAQEGASASRRGEFVLAAKAYTRAYRLSNNATFLRHIYEAYRSVKDYEMARDALAAYLAQETEPIRDRAKLEEKVAAMTRALGPARPFPPREEGTAARPAAGAPVPRGTAARGTQGAQTQGSQTQGSQTQGSQTQGGPVAPGQTGTSAGALAGPRAGEPDPAGTGMVSDGMPGPAPESAPPPPPPPPETIDKRPPWASWIGGGFHATNAGPGGRVEVGIPLKVAIGEGMLSIQLAATYWGYAVSLLGITMAYHNAGFFPGAHFEYPVFQRWGRLSIVGEAGLGFLFSTFLMPSAPLYQKDPYVNSYYGIGRSAAGVRFVFPFGLFTDLKPLGVGIAMGSQSTNVLGVVSRGFAVFPFYEFSWTVGYRFR